MSPDASGIREEIYGDDGPSLTRLIKAGGVRATARLGAAFAWTGLCLAWLLAGMSVLAALPTRRRRWRHRTIRRWARGLGWLVGMRVIIRGPRPAAPFFLVTNHLGYVDIVLLLGQVEGVFVAKQELGEWPLLGYLTRLTGTIFLNRDRPRDAIRVLDAIEHRVREGDGVIAFPEGTSSGGADVGPMKPALFEWAARRQFPVLVASIRYLTPAGGPPAAQAICWWGSMAFLPHLVALCGLRGFEARLTFAEDPIIGPGRSELAARARTRIAGLLAGGHRTESE